MSEMAEDTNFDVCWEPVTCKGHSPGCISNHRAAVFGNSVIFFGGKKDYNNIPHAYEFDSHHHKWSKLN